MNTSADYRVSVPVTAILAEPRPDAECISEALYGEHVTKLDRHGAMLRICQVHDGYEGFVNIADLQVLANVSSLLRQSTHWVHHRSTLLFDQPALKSLVKHRIPFGAALTLTETVNSSFSRTACNHYIWSSHCLPTHERHPADPLHIARSHFLGCPYRWGGRTPEGADCSGLIQQLARSQGLSIPRDSFDQERSLRATVENDAQQALDLVYWPGHTGILVSPVDVLHATAHSLCCVIEPLEQVIKRAGPVSSVKRLFL